ncbi:MAG: 2-phospho-L-lactate transferase CofD family protein, partial [Anaerolineales bacterium]|nr:2-phospho-L-lactate transferase CofD family protein [Anaerolineales bacterium]
LLLSALEKVTGSFEKAVEEVGKIMNIKGKVLPVTQNKVRLKMILNDGNVLQGEGEICTSRVLDQGYQSIYLEPFPKADPHALQEIMDADLVIVGPGGLYSSLIPNLLVEGVSKALRDTEATTIYIANLMNKKGQTTGFSVSRHLQELSRFLGKDIFDHVLVNNGVPAADLVKRYETEAALVENDMQDDPRVICANLLEDQMHQANSADALAKHRTLIRHDAHKVAAEIMKIVVDL